jgi:putative lipoic acid-binding regulatory protein
MKKNSSLMTFPCDFRIKIIGENSSSFALEITDIARKHYPDIKDSAIQLNPSKAENYLAISIDLYVKNQKTLDLLYMELTKHPNIKMVL